MVVAIKIEFSEDVPPRKRGRPKGKNRVPLTQEERKARNAHYERERRGAYSSALNHLASVLECPDSMSGDDIIKMATLCIKKLTNTNNRESLDFLRHVDGLLNYQIEKLCPQLGISVDEIDNLEIGILDANTNEIPEDILTRANAMPNISTSSANAYDVDENAKDETAQLKTHNKKRGRKRRKLEASHNQACPSEKSTPSQSGVQSTSARRTVSNRNYSDTTIRPPSFSREWSSNLEPFTSYPSTPSSEGSMYPSKDGSSSLSSVEYPPISGYKGDLTSSFQWTNSIATLSNERMTSYQKSQDAVPSSIKVTSSADPSNLPGISAPAESLAASVHHVKHGYSNVPISQPGAWSLQSVQPFTFETASSESSTFETLSPETISAVYPYEDASHETDNVISYESSMHESPSSEAVISDGYDRNASSCGTASYDTASHETASRDADSPEIIIPESIMPQLLAYFPVWPTPESIPSTSPPNPDLQWSSTEIQPVPQLQLQNQTLQCDHPEWFGQQPFYCEPQTNINNAAHLSQSPFPHLEELSAPVQDPWPTLSHETDQMANDFFLQNDGLADNYFEEFFPNV